MVRNGADLKQIGQGGSKALEPGWGCKQGTGLDGTLLDSFRVLGTWMGSTTTLVAVVN